MMAAINAYLEDRFNKSIPVEELPQIEQTKADSDMAKLLVTRGNEELNADGAYLLKNLLERDFGYLFAVLKAINIENLLFFIYFNSTL